MNTNIDTYKNGNQASRQHLHHPSSYNNITINNSSKNNKSSEQRIRIAVSLTTLPSRIEHIESTLSSLLVNQTMALDTLYLVLPKTKWILTSQEETIHYKIPDFLKNLTKHDDRLEILRPEYDYGPVDKMLYSLQEEEQRSISNDSTTKLIYLDDDIVYHKNVIKTLVTKSLEYPDSVVALSGCKLRSHFRQIKHGFPRSKYDTHPNLYFLLSGAESLIRDEVVDVVQGFAGVLVQPSFFDVPEFLELVQTVTRVHDIWKSDDFIISGYLEHKRVPKRVVVSDALSNVNKPAAQKDNLGNGMHRQVMQTAHDLQSRLRIWTEHSFVDYLSLDDYWRDLIDCEAGHQTGCQKALATAKHNDTAIITTALNSNSTTSNSNSTTSNSNSTQLRKPKNGTAITHYTLTELLDNYLLPSPQT